MANRISISLSKQSKAGVVSMRNITIRERILRWLLGNPHHLMVITPSENVQQLEINEIKEETE